MDTTEAFFRSYQFYKLVHFSGLILLFMSLGGAITATLALGEKPSGRVRKIIAISHGIALLLVLVGGFGLLAKLGLTRGMPGWAIAKLCIWVVMGGAISLAYRSAHKTVRVWLAVILLGVTAGYLAITKTSFASDNKATDAAQTLRAIAGE